MTEPKVIDSPEFIYLSYGDLNYSYRGAVTHRQLMNDGYVGWREDKIDETDIKYVRADLFEHQAKEIEALRAELESAYEQGWREAAEWANADDLVCDIGSPAYLTDRARRIGR